MSTAAKFSSEVKFGQLLNLEYYLHKLVDEVANSSRWQNLKQQKTK